MTRADVDAFLDVLESAGLVSYRKLFDGMQGETRMTSEDFPMAIGARIGPATMAARSGLAVALIA